MGALVAEALILLICTCWVLLLQQLVFLPEAFALQRRFLLHVRPE